MAICRMCGTEVNDRFCPVCGSEVQQSQGQNQWQQPQQNQWQQPQRPQQNQWQQPQRPQQNQWQQPQQPQQNQWGMNGRQDMMPGTGIAGIIFLVISTLLAVGIMIYLTSDVREEYKDIVGLGPSILFIVVFAGAAAAAIIASVKKKFGISALLMLIQTMAAIIACIILNLIIFDEARGMISPEDIMNTMDLILLYSRYVDWGFGASICIFAGIFGAIPWIISFILMLVARGSVNKQSMPVRY